jgi:hypothetical protein
LYQVSLKPTITIVLKALLISFTTDEIIGRARQVIPKCARTKARIWKF